MIVTLTGVSGTGKTTVCKELIKHHGNKFLVSITTRLPRSSDLDGEFEYLSKEQFLKEKNENKFLWTTSYADNWYGTRKCDVDNALSSKETHLMILVPPVVPILHGYAKVTSIFLENLPSNILEQRMLQRGDSLETTRKRLLALNDWQLEAQKTPYYIFISSEGTPEDILQRIIGKI